MKILLVSERRGHAATVCLGRGKLFFALAFVFLVLPVAALTTGMYWGASGAPSSDVDIAWQQEIAQQREALREAQRVAEENLNALALRLGEMRARVMRLDAVGQRLTQMAGLDSGEFDFEQAPAQGGPETNSALDPIAVPDFVSLLKDLEQQLDDRTRQLGVLESLLMNRNLQAEVVPAGRPITQGWLSSHFGTRTDPINGKRAFHSGMDFAGKKGSDVIAVAAGVVTYAADRYGYGMLVEINHGGGYATRYGHNDEVLVEVGDTVKKGQVIAKMGSSGRSTGPHVHFEVLQDGKTVDPQKYIQAAK